MDIVAPIHRFDRWQRAHRFPAAVWGVNQKFGDDNANLWVVTLGWYGFTAIIPLLLVVVTVLGYIGQQSLGSGLVDSLRHFPIIGPSIQIGRGPSSLHGSVAGLAIGLVGLLYGAQGVTQTAEQTMSAVWNVPMVERPGFLPRLQRSLLGLLTIGVTFLVDAVISGYATGSGRPWAVRIPVIVVLLAFNVGAYLLAFRVLTPKVVPTRELRTGAWIGGIAFSVLITLGTGLVQHQLRNTSNTYGTFGSVIGVVAFLLLLAKLSVYAAETNVVLSRKLYPRKVLGDPTDADEQVWRDLAHETRRRPDQRVGVGFGPAALEEAVVDARRSAGDGSSTSGL